MFKRPPLTRVCWVLLCLLAMTLGVSVPKTLAQNVDAEITLNVDPGYGSYFREDTWLPIRIEVANDGADVVGSLVVRPETSGSAVPNTFSAPISLPTGSRKTAFLYIAARSFAQRLRVELLDEQNFVYAASDVIVRHIQPSDQLYVVVSESAVGTVDLSSVTFGGNRAFQANWRLDSLPDRAAALDAVNVMVFEDIDTGALPPAQAQAIANWVAQGGHLIVTGGANWERTAAGLLDLLPLMPDGSTTIDNVNALTTLSNDAADLRGQTVVATGQLAPDAQILAAHESGVPLVARHTYGGGTVDYLAVDPNAQPLRLWPGLTDLWFTLLSSTNPQPTWGQGFGDWEQAINAVEILPGVNLLPEVLSLLSFLGLYILLIGPLNYLVLNRINRREWAWVTIPVLIVMFSVFAWVFGFNLRGNEVILSRLSVVQSWANVESARVDQLVGLLSPLRATYSLSVTDNRLLRPVTRPSTSGIFGGGGGQTNINISQTDIFTADQFPVDASFIASFIASGFIEKPAISGQVGLSLIEESEDGPVQQLRGSVRNDSDQPLTDPVILARGQVLPLEGTLEPGDLKTFENRVLLQDPPQPSALEPSFDVGTSVFGIRYASRFDSEMTARRIMGAEVYRAIDLNQPFADAVIEQESRRRQAFLRSFMADRYNSAGLGNRVYLAGWVSGAPLDFTVEGAQWSSKDTTLYIVELVVDSGTATRSQQVTLAPDQFTWVTRAREGVTNYTGPFSLRLSPGDALVLQFTPLPDAQLSAVDELIINVERNTSFARVSPLKLWDWINHEWVNVEIEGRQLVIADPRAFIGPQNAVQMQLTMDATGGFLDLGNIAIRQKGRF